MEEKKTTSCEFLSLALNPAVKKKFVKEYNLYVKKNKDKPYKISRGIFVNELLQKYSETNESKSA